MADTTDAQKEILKKYISKLQNPDQVKQGLMADSDLGSSVMDSPAQRAMYNAQHDQNMSPENMVTGMGMPAMGIMREGNALNIMDAMDLRKANINPASQHIAPYDGGEAAFNHRLNGLDDVNYAVKNNQVIGHLGLDDNGSIKAAYVNPEFRRQGVAEQLYLDAAKKNGILKSDDLDAMEPEAVSLWEKLKKQYPDAVIKTRQGYQLNGQKIR